MYVNKYIQIIKRNEKDIYERIMFLVDKNIELKNNSKRLSSEDERINFVREQYLNSIDQSSPNFDESKIDKDLHGRIRGKVISYQLMDNPKYKEIETLLEIMEET